MVGEKETQLEVVLSLSLQAHASFIFWEEEKTNLSPSTQPPGWSEVWGHRGNQKAR